MSTLEIQGYPKKKKKKKKKKKNIDLPATLLYIITIIDLSSGWLAGCPDETDKKC